MGGGEDGEWAIVIFSTLAECSYCEEILVFFQFWLAGAEPCEPKLKRRGDGDPSSLPRRSRGRREGNPSAA